MDAFRLIADRKIQEAMEEGAFDDLFGRGLPLPLDDDPCEDPSLRMAHRLLRNNGFAPAWIEESKDIDAEIRRLRYRSTFSAEDFRVRAAALNHRILAFNLKAPSASVHKQPLELT